MTARVAYAAAHVAGEGSRIDWDATLAYRRHLWSCGLRVADAMDTAQRGMGLDWPLARELIVRSVAEARACGGGIACGAGTDQLRDGAGLDDVRAAYEEQFELIEGEGAPAIMMASRALARCARSADDYRAVYGAVLSQARRPVILHWLGEMFDPELAGYWGDDPDEVVLSIVSEHADRVDGIKVSLLDASREVALRERLPAGVRMYTGDDFNYPELIRSGSDALLGIFDAIAPVAARALAALEAGEEDEYERLLAPTVALSRHIFEPPTYHYKTGLVYLAWRNGHQERFTMLGGFETARSPEHLARLAELAQRAGLLS